MFVGGNCKQLESSMYHDTERCRPFTGFTFVNALFMHMKRSQQAFGSVIKQVITLWGMEAWNLAILGGKQIVLYRHYIQQHPLWCSSFMYMLLCRTIQCPQGASWIHTGVWTTSKHSKIYASSSLLRIYVALQIYWTWILQEEESSPFYNIMCRLVQNGCSHAFGVAGDFNLLLLVSWESQSEVGKLYLTTWECCLNMLLFQHVCTSASAVLLSSRGVLHAGGPAGSYSFVWVKWVVCCAAQADFESFGGWSSPQSILIQIQMQVSPALQTVETPNVVQNQWVRPKLKLWPWLWPQSQSVQTNTITHC